MPFKTKNRMKTVILITTNVK